MSIDRSVIICVGAATEVEALKNALTEAEGKAVQQQAARKKLKARVDKIQQELQDAVKKCEALERDASVRETELTKARQSTEAAQNEARGALQEIQEAKKIAAGKAFNMQSKYAERKYLLLTRIRSCPGAFADLPRSVSDAAEFFRAREGNSTEKLLWLQYDVPELGQQQVIQVIMSF